MFTPTLYIVWGLARPVSCRPYAQRCDRPLPPLLFLPVCWSISSRPILPPSVPNRSSGSSVLPPLRLLRAPFFCGRRSSFPFPCFCRDTHFLLCCSAGALILVASALQLFVCSPSALAAPLHPSVPPDLLPLVASWRDRGSTLLCSFFASLLPSAGFCLPAGRGRFLLRPCEAACRRFGAALLCFEPSSSLTLLCSGPASFLFFGWLRPRLPADPICCCLPPMSRLAACWPWPSPRGCSLPPFLLTVGSSAFLLWPYPGSHFCLSCLPPFCPRPVAVGGCSRPGLSVWPCALTWCPCPFLTARWREAAPRPVGVPLHQLSPGLWPVARCSCSGVRFLALRVLLGAGLLLRPSARFLLVGAAPCWAPTLSVGPPSADPCCSVVRLLLRSPGYFLSPPACGRWRVVAARGSVFWPCGCCSVLGCCLVRRRTFCGWVLLCGRAAASSVGLLPLSPGLWPVACLAARGSVFWPCGCCSVLGCCLVRRRTFCGWVLPCGRAAASSVGLLPLSPGLWPPVAGGVFSCSAAPFPAAGPSSVLGSCFVRRPTFSRWVLLCARLPASSVGPLSSARCSLWPRCSFASWATFCGWVLPYGPLLPPLPAYFLFLGLDLSWAPASSVGALSPGGCPFRRRLLLPPSMHFPRGLPSGLDLSWACCFVRRRPFCRWVLPCGRALGVCAVER